MQPDRLRRVQETIAQSPAVDEVLDVYAIHLAPEDVLVAAKVHPVADQSGEQLAGLLDDLDVHLRSELPEVGEVFIDITAHRLPAPARDA